ncbi:uncharacterized protein EHS24_006917 [Apiotrichum porosum]|uniref:Uncharacterized protein n=1 Tax=Apiotrichum porosum TaxID=105984 RepID=A0A427XWK4_9TREE|nr:uncharacterized protein EHS24_006917 [Apiotrichum porosum]RSH83249.1 hypothetical protein EHS24_006917 [Apiotrichum porosum]
MTTTTTSAERQQAARETFPLKHTLTTISGGCTFTTVFYSACNMYYHAPMSEPKTPEDPDTPIASDPPRTDIRLLVLPFYCALLVVIHLQRWVYGRPQSCGLYTGFIAEAGFAIAMVLVYAAGMSKKWASVTFILMYGVVYFELLIRFRIHYKKFCRELDAQEATADLELGTAAAEQPATTPTTQQSAPATTLPISAKTIITQAKRQTVATLLVTAIATALLILAARPDEDTLTPLDATMAIYVLSWATYLAALCNWSRLFVSNTAVGVLTFVAPCTALLPPAIHLLNVYHLTPTFGSVEGLLVLAVPVAAIVAVHLWYIRVAHEQRLHAEPMEWEPKRSHGWWLPAIPHFFTTSLLFLAAAPRGHPFHTLLSIPTLLAASLFLCLTLAGHFKAWMFQHSDRPPLRHLAIVCTTFLAIVLGVFLSAWLLVPAAFMGFVSIIRTYNRIIKEEAPEQQEEMLTAILPKA